MSKTAVFHTIESGFVQTKSGIREVFWINTHNIPAQQLFCSRKKALDYINMRYDPDYEPEEPCYDS